MRKPPLLVVLSVLLALGHPPAGLTEGAIGVSSVATVYAKVAGAKDITISSYVLEPDGAMVRALDSAAAAGARITVYLPLRPYDPDGVIAPANAASEKALQGKAHIYLTTYELHMKAVVLPDGVFLSDRNWDTPRETVLWDTDPRDRQISIGAIEGSTGSTRSFWTRKADALQAEAAIISTGGASAVYVESESFGYGPIYDAIRDLASTEARPHIELLVADREYDARAIVALERRGVVVRVGRTNQKLTINGAISWIGSANATRATRELANQVDWGMAFNDASVARALAGAFQSDWSYAEPRSSLSARSNR